MAVLHLNDQSFQGAVEANSVLLVDFWATWCGPCKMIAPAVEAAAAALDGRAAVAKVDVDEAGNLARTFGVVSIPTLVVVKDGKEVERHVGLASQDALVAMVNKHLS